MDETPYRRERFPGACRFLGCHLEMAHTHLVCKVCGAVDLRGHCPICRQFQFEVAQEYARFLKTRGVLRPGTLRLRAA